MPWGRHRQPLIFRLIGVIGQPLFWIFYTLIALVLNLHRGWKQIRYNLYLYSRVIPKTFLKLQPPHPQISSPPHSSFLTIILRIITILIIITSMSAGYIFYQVIIKGLPSPQELVTKRPAVSTKIYDRNGSLLYKIYHDENRTIIPISELPPYIGNATIAIEDAAFYQHPGFSVKGIIRALRKNATSDTVQGGSTITQQLVKNTLLTNERTLTRKIKELWLSLLVEYYFTKDEILSMYLNEVGYGGSAYGIEEAAQQYFGKSAKNVSLAEAALLAGLPQSPTAYSPFGANPELAVARQQHVLSRMVDEKYITQDEANKAAQETLHFSSPKTDINAPHFVMWVKDQLVKQYGESVLTQDGLEVTTTLDSHIQKLAEMAIQQELAKLKGLNVNNAAVLVTNPQTGEILAMVGSANYFDTTHDGQVNVTLRLRQPGSSIKPLTYALAMSQHLITPATRILDEPIVYSSPGGSPYAPQNYDGRFHGNVTVRQALGNSFNIPAVKTLALVGVPNLVNFATTMGITTWDDPHRYGLALTLGGGEIRMIDMAQAYGVFATGGRKVPLTPIIRVVNKPANQIQEFICSLTTHSLSVQAAENHPCSGSNVLDPGVAFLISNILSDNQARSMEFGLHSVLVIPNQQVAVKTGTTNDLRDNWTFGYTKDYLVASWVGNNDNTPMSHVASGITGASPIWQAVMKALLSDKPTQTFTPPDDIVSLPSCTGDQMEYYLQGTQPDASCVSTSLPSPTPIPLLTPPRDQILNGITTTNPAPKPTSMPQYRKQPTRQNRYH